MKVPRIKTIGTSLSEPHIDWWLVQPWFDSHIPENLYNEHGKRHTAVICWIITFSNSLCNTH